MIVAHIPGSWRGVLVGLLSIVLLTACWPAGRSDAVLLRVANSSFVEVEDLVVIFPQERLSFGTIRAQQTTAYQDVKDGIYRYAALQLTIAGEQRSFPAIDWLGETPLAPGKYTLHLKIDPTDAEAWRQVTHEIRSDE